MQMSAVTPLQPQAPPEISPLLHHKGQSESTRYSVQLDSISIFLPAPRSLGHRQDWKNQGNVLRKEELQQKSSWPVIPAERQGKTKQLLTLRRWHIVELCTQISLAQHNQQCISTVIAIRNATRMVGLC